MSTFSRTTKLNLISEIQEVNAALVQSGSDYRYKYGHRNGYHAVDLMRIEAGQTNWMCVACMDCGETPRVLITRLNNEFDYYLGRKFKA